MVGPAGTGHLVLVVELSYRLNRTDRESAVVAVASSKRSTGAWSHLGKLVNGVARYSIGPPAMASGHSRHSGSAHRVIDGSDLNASAAVATRSRAGKTRQVL